MKKYKKMYFYIATKQTPMKKLHLMLIMAIFIIANANYSFAQIDSLAKPLKTDLNSQYSELTRNAKTYGVFTLVNTKDMNNVFKNHKDSLNKTTETHNKLFTKFNKNKIEIDSLKQYISSIENKLAIKPEVVNLVNIAGFTVSLSSYNLILWSLLIIFGISTFLIYIISKKRIADGELKNELYNALNEEFILFKNKSVERERKLARELQDERNKWDEFNKN